MSTVQRDPNSLLTDLEVADLLKIGRSTLWAWVKDGKAPKPVRNGRCTRWRYGDIVAMHIQKEGAA